MRRPFLILLLLIALATTAVLGNAAEDSLDRLGYGPSKVSTSGDTVRATYTLRPGSDETEIVQSAVIVMFILSAEYPDSNQIIITQLVGDTPVQRITVSTADVLLLFGEQIDARTFWQLARVETMPAENSGGGWIWGVLGVLGLLFFGMIGLVIVIVIIWFVIKSGKKKNGGN